MSSRKDYFNIFDKLIFRIIRPYISDYKYALYSLRRFDNKNPNLETPKTFNEKLRWLSLFCRNPLYKIYADKLAVRDCLRDKIESKYFSKIYGFWSSPKDIEWDILPNEFILKVNCGNGGNFIIKDKSNIDKKKIIKKINQFLKKDFFRAGREWVYKDIQKRIVAEELLKDEKGDIPIDYKIFCFGGKPKYIQVDIDRFTAHKRAIYSIDWQLMNLKYDYPKPDKNIQRPLKLDEMINLAKRLSLGIPFVRVDLFSLPEIKFGELTFYPEAAQGQFEPEFWNKKFGDLIKLKKY